MADPYDDVDPYDTEVAAPGATPRGAVPSGGSRDQYAQIVERRQDAIKQTQSILDKTIQEMRSRHDGSGPGQMNLPLLAFASGLLKTTPGRQSNFGNELGEGLSRMVPVIHQQRMGDTEFLRGIADLQAKSGQLSDAPLRDLQKELSSLDVAGVRGNRPIVNSTTGVTVFPNHFGAGDHGIMKPGSHDIVRASDISGGGAAKPTPVGGGTPEEDIKFLQDVVHSDIKPGTMVKDIKYDKLAAVARQDPAKAKELWDLINYNQDIKAITSQRGSKYEARDLLREAKEIDETFSPALYDNVKKSRGEWEGQGKMLQSIVSAQTAINHIGGLMKNAAALENGDLQAVNRIKQWVATQTGKPAPTNFDAVAKLAGDELAKFIGGQGQVAEGSKEDIARIFSKAKSPEQLAGAIRETVELLEGRLKPLAAAKQVAFGNRQKITPEKLLGDSGEIFRKVMDKSIDIKTPEGRRAWGVESSEGSPQLPKLSPAEAAKLEPGTPFLDLDGKKRWRK